MDHIELPDDQKLLDATLSPATLQVAPDVLQAAPELTSDIILYLEPNKLPSAVHAGLCEVAKHPARPGSFRLLSPNEGIDAYTLAISHGAWLVSFDQDDSLEPGQFIIDPVVANDLGTSEDLRHGRLDILVRFKRPCEAFRALGHILAATRYALTLATAPSMKGDVDAAGAASPTEDEHMSASSSTGSSNSRSRTLGKILNFLQREETANFETLGALVDASRNGVPNVDSVKFFLRQQALIGCNLLHLYTEFVTLFLFLSHYHSWLYFSFARSGSWCCCLQRTKAQYWRSLLRVSDSGKLMPFHLSPSSATSAALTPSKSCATLTTTPSTSALNLSPAFKPLPTCLSFSNGRVMPT